MTWLEFLGEMAWKSTVILAAPCAGAFLLRRGAAAIRHFVWTAAFATLLILPAAVLMIPKWPVRNTVNVVPGTVVVRVTEAAAAPGRTPINLPAVFWVSGTAVMLLRFLLGAGSTTWMARRGSVAAYAEPVTWELSAQLGIRRVPQVLESVSAPVPLVWGVVRPVVLLPKAAREWPLDRLRVVLLHELMHIRRMDLQAQIVAQAAFCLYWFHPLAWVAWRRLRRDRERACDDAVLLCGMAPHDYAGHLLDLVRALAARRNRWVQAPAMAEASDLESRVRHLLDRNRKRHPLSWRAAASIAAVCAIALLPIASVTTHAQAPSGVLAGVVQDPSSTPVSHCSVTAKNQDGIHREVTTADANGEYRFQSIPSGHYTLEFSSPGFALQRVEVDLVAGASSIVDSHLAIGRITETVKARSQESAAMPKERILIRTMPSGQVQVARLIRQPRPVYPEELKRQGIQGTVLILAVISKDGDVLNPRVVNTVDPGLAQAALDAVRQWRYEPTRLNGNPVEVVTNISVEFQLDN